MRSSGRVLRGPLSRVLALVAWVASGSGSAYAADPIAQAKAKAHYSRGVKHYDLAEYPQALEAFKEAYRAADEPAFLFNIAQCHRKLGQHDEAVTFYKNYLRRAPGAPNRAEVERLIAELELAQARGGPAPFREGPASSAPPGQAVAPGQAAAPVPVPRLSPAAAAAAAPAERPAGIDVSRPLDEGEIVDKPFYRTWWFWTGTTAVVAGVVVTAVILGSRGAADPLCSECVATGAIGGGS